MDKKRRQRGHEKQQDFDTNAKDWGHIPVNGAALDSSESKV